MDALRQASMDQTLEVSVHTANKTTLGAPFTKTTPDMPPGQTIKAKKGGSRQAQGRGYIM
jgi:hypothetical protein